MTPISERAISFGQIAVEYDRYRPAPPAEAARWLLPTAGGQVAELCAGTGTFSRLLASLVGRVVAVDLDPRMLAVLRTRSPGVDPVCASGEVLPFGDGVLDAVVVSSGWHWLDAHRAMPEVARVLRPGGVLGVVWSGPDRRVDWVGELLGRRRTEDSTSSGSRRVLSIPSGQPFTSPEHWVKEWSMQRSPAELVGLAGTYSGAIISVPGERLVTARGVAASIDEQPMLRGRERIDLPMRTVCWRAVRLAV